MYFKYQFRTNALIYADLILMLLLSFHLPDPWEALHILFALRGLSQVVAATGFKPKCRS